MVNISHDGNRYSLQNYIDGKITERHITDLKLFHYDPQNPKNMSLADIALRDRIHEFPVEAVLEITSRLHRGCSRGTTHQVIGPVIQD